MTVWPFGSIRSSGAGPPGIAGRLGTDIGGQAIAAEHMADQPPAPLSASLTSGEVNYRVGITPEDHRSGRTPGPRKRSQSSVAKVPSGSRRGSPALCPFATSGAGTKPGESPAHPAAAARQQADAGQGVPAMPADQTPQNGGVRIIRRVTSKSRSAPPSQSVRVGAKRGGSVVRIPIDHEVAARRVAPAGPAERSSGSGDGGRVPGSAGRRISART